jgi:hypothetical protein
METKVVSYKSADLDIRVVVGEETAIARMRRIRAKVVAVQNATDDEDENIFRIVFYPDAMAATLEYHGFEKPTFEEFIALPPNFIDQWMDAIWKLIPEWYNMSLPEDKRTTESPEVAEKKELS